MIAPLLAAAAAALPASLPAPATPRERAVKGEIVVSVQHLDRPIRQVRVLGFVGRPAAQVYRVFTDFPNYPKVFPYLKRCEIKEPDPIHPTTYSVFPMPWPFPDRWVTSRVDTNPRLHRVSWDYLNGNIRHYSGTVRVEALGPSSCLVDLEANIDPSLPWIPKPLLNWFTKNALPNVIVDVRRYLGEDVERHWE